MSGYRRVAFFIPAIVFLACAICFSLNKIFKKDYFFTLGACLFFIGIGLFCGTLVGIAFEAVLNSING